MKPPADKSISMITRFHVEDYHYVLKRDLVANQINMVCKLQTFASPQMIDIQGPWQIARRMIRIRRYVITRSRGVNIEHSIMEGLL